jgi:TIR domain
VNKDKIFISYRREDAADVAGRIRDWLVQTQHVARDDVFMDVITLLPGTDFIQAIEQTISKCRAMIVIISPSWLAQFNAPATSYVRWETEVALRNNLLIIPVLVGGAQMPPAERLPESIRALTRRNARPVRPDSFDYDMGWVGRGLGVSGRARVGWITAVSAILLIVLSLGILSQGPEGNPVYRAFHTPTATATATATAPTATTAGPTDPRAKFLQYPPTHRYTLSLPTGADATTIASAKGPWTRLGPISSTQVPTCGFRDYALHSQSAPNKGWYCFTDPGVSYGDAYISIGMTFNGGTTGALGCRQAAVAGYHVQLSNNGAYVLSNEAAVVFARGTAQGVGKTNTLGILAVQNRISFFINDRQFGNTVQDSNSASGGMFILGGGGDVSFNNLQIWVLNPDGSLRS